jgi:prepilin-type N-terminal cleavage/methylation domain-containing protein
MHRKAFTLIELLIVIALLAILVTLILGNFFTSLKKGRDARRKADLSQIQKSLELFYEDRRVYPTQAPGDGFVFKSEFADQTTGKVYMKKVSSDPAGVYEYKYETDSDGTYYKLFACLESDQQILPYLSNPTNYTCNIQCFGPDKSPTTQGCVWGVTSTNTTP